MLGQSLPLKIINSHSESSSYILDFNNGLYRINIDGRWLSLKNSFPESFKFPHLQNWFTIDRLPDPQQCLYIHCQIESLFFPKNNICLLIGYAEKYRKYFYPLQIDLDKMICYLTGQPIYYNFNQAVALDIESEPPVLRIHSFSRANPDQNAYQPRSKRDLDLFWEPPVNLIRTFTLNPEPSVYLTSCST